MDKICNFTPNEERWYSVENFEGEIWKDIAGFEGFYQISNYGRVKSLRRYKSNWSKKQIVNEKIKRYSDNGHGYIIVPLSKNNKQKMFYVHRLVAIAFLQNPLNLPEINHKDENKSNNKIDNLEWCTGLYNANYGSAKYRAQEKRKANGWLKSIDMYDLKGNLLKHYIKAYDVEKDGLSRRGVYATCQKRTRSYKGCVFRFSGDTFSYREREKHTFGEKKKVIKTDSKGKIVHIYQSIKEAEKENGFGRNYLYSATYALTRKAYINGYYYEIKKGTNDNKIQLC